MSPQYGNNIESTPRKPVVDSVSSIYRHTFIHYHSWSIHCHLSVGVYVDPSDKPVIQAVSGMGTQVFVVIFDTSCI